MEDKLDKEYESLFKPACYVIRAYFFECLSNLSNPTGTGVTMLQLRPEQMKVLQQTTLGDFFERMVAHLNRVFPRRCRELGEERIRQMVRLNYQQAATYDIRSERDVCAYVDVLFILNREDVSGPDMQWAKEILLGARVGASQKIVRLREEARQRVRKMSLVK